MAAEDLGDSSEETKRKSGAGIELWPRRGVRVNRGSVGFSVIVHRRMRRMIHTMLAIQFE